MGHSPAALSEAYERLEECFGSPEIIEKSLFDRLIHFPSVSGKDPVKMKELGDLIQELEASKLESCLPGLSHFVTSPGIAPIVDRLPPNIQDRWLSNTGFRLLIGSTDHLKSDATVKRPHKSLVSAHRIDISKEGWFKQQS